MSLIPRREGVATENQIQDFTREFHTVMRSILCAETMDPACGDFDPEHPWRGQDIAIVPNLFEELQATFPEEQFCIARGQRRIPSQGPPLEPIHTWVNHLVTPLHESHVVDVAAESHRWGTLAELQHAGAVYEGLITFPDSATYVEHVMGGDPTALRRIHLARDLFECAIIEESSEPTILEVKEAS